MIILKETFHYNDDPTYRQQRLEQLAEKFRRKVALRESWLSDMTQVLSELNKGQDVHAVDAALKRHEAISADIQAGETRIQVVRDIVKELAQEKFHDVKLFKERWVEGRAVSWLM